jgi:NTP pyrophosphatase (non-canonical NTP hydrolase)
MAKKKAKRKKGLVSVDFDKASLKRSVSRKKEKLSRELGKFTGELSEHIDESEDIKKLKKEIKERPLLYVALAFTLGITLATLMRRK